jgi:chromosome condensin MukBEF MukE localization factor
VVERDAADGAFSRSDTLGAYFCVRDEAKIGKTLRVANDPEGRDLWPTPREAQQREVRQREALQCEAEARQRAERRVAELEAELAKRGGT